jgi:fumarylpyruvate hydrolase
MGYVISPVAAPVVPVVGTSDVFPVNRIFCVGRNYADHVREMGGNPEREAPVFFMKPGAAVLSDGKDFPYPGHSQDVHYEVELVVAVKEGGGNISPQEALSHVYGYAIGLDMTRRDLQQDARKKGQPWEVGKSFDYSAPCSKIAPAEKIGHPSKGAIWLDLNGKRVQNSDISQLIWSVSEVIATLSTYFQLTAGDLIFTGTPSGVGPVRRGDALHGAVENVSELTVRVV